MLKCLINIKFNHFSPVFLFFFSSGPKNPLHHYKCDLTTYLTNIHLLACNINTYTTYQWFLCRKLYRIIFMLNQSFNDKCLLCSLSLCIFVSTKRDNNHN